MRKNGSFVWNTIFDSAHMIEKLIFKERWNSWLGYLCDTYRDVILGYKECKSLAKKIKKWVETI